MSTKTATNGSFQKPKGFFSQISNQVLRDTSLSLKAKGLYSLITSFITLPNFTLYKAYLMSMCSEGRCAFDSAWKELVGAGYLEHSRSRQPDGTFLYEYLLTMPSLKGKAELTIPEKSSAKIEPAVPKEETPLTEKQAPVSYIYNKTLNNNTNSISQERRAELKNQIDYSFFETEFKNHPQQKATLLFFIEYLATLPTEETAFIDSCFLMDFFATIKQKQIPRVYHPMAYWRTVFHNYIQEHALMSLIV